MTKRVSQKASALFGGILITSLFFSSCYNQLKEELVESDIPILVKSSILPPSTRVSNEQFENKDCIGLFLKLENEELSQAYLQNAKFTFQKGNDFAPAKELYYPKTKEPLEIISYYPYQEDILTDKGLFRVGLDASKTKTEDVALTDFLISRKEEVYPDLKPQLLNFQHALAKVELEIKPSTGYTAEEILSIHPVVKLHNLATQALFDPQTLRFTEHAEFKNLSAQGSWKIDGKLLKGGSFIYIPQEGPHTSEFLTIEAENVTYKCPFPEDWTLQSGTVNRLTINYTPWKGIEIEKAESSIKPWTPGQDGESTSEMETSSIPLSTFNFDQAPTYTLLNSQNEVRAEVCRELLVKDKLKSEVVVLYPINKEGGISNKGICLKATDQTLNLVGDTIVWDNVDNSFTLAKHKSELPGTHFFINAEGEICFSKPEVCEQIHAKQAYWEGEDKVKYPIQKIGTQYWLTKNWTEKQKSDGTPFAYEPNKVTINAGYTTKSEIKGEYYYSRAAVESELVAPKGWAIPSSLEWETLFKYIQNDYNLLKSGEWQLGSSSPINTHLNIVSIGTFARNQHVIGSTGYWAYDSNKSTKTTAILFHDASKLHDLEVRPIESNDYALSIRLVKR